MTKSQTSQETVTSRLPADWVAALFAKFQVRYGHKWVSQIDGLEKIAASEWGSHLFGLTGEQIKHGLETWNGDWPPSATEFRKACEGKAVNEFGLDYIPECHRIKNPERLLESDELKAHRREVGKKGVADLKTILKGGK